jgi:hypothetical protein
MEPARRKDWEILNLVFSIVLDLVAIVILYNYKGKEKLWK